MADQLHVFVGTFASRDDACLHTEAQWEPEPSDSVTDAEYEAWDDRNPIWGFCAEQIDDAYLDSDFVETIDGDNRYDYLATYLVNDDDIDTIRQFDSDANILLLIFPDALSGFDTALRSTSLMKYVGGFDFRWP